MLQQLGDRMGTCTRAGSEPGFLEPMPDESHGERRTGETWKEIWAQITKDLEEQV